VQTRIDFETRTGQQVSNPVTVSAVNKEYGKGSHAATVLNDINLTVREGEFVSIMGPSGCGKTTLLQLIAGFETVSSGAIECVGARVTKPSVDRGIVLQKPALYPWMNVIENVMFGLKATGQGKNARPIAERLLQEVGLKGYERHKVYELSGGMQHRVSIARTLALSPKVLLMDEPFGALDAQTRAEMQSFLLELWQQHRSTVIFVTHDIEEGLLLSDRVVVLGKGTEGIREIVEVGIPRPRRYDVTLTQEFIDLRRTLKNLITGKNQNQTGD